MRVTLSNALSLAAALGTLSSTFQHLVHNGFKSLLKQLYFPVIDAIQFVKLKIITKIKKCFLKLLKGGAVLLNGCKGDDEKPQTTSKVDDAVKATYTKLSLVLNVFK